MARAHARPARLSVAVVRRAKHLGRQREAVADGLTAGSHVHADGFRAVFRADFLGLADDELGCLIPADSLPFVQPAVFRVALHGVQKAIGVIHRFLQREATGAKAPARELMVGVAFDLDELAVFDEQADAASNGVASRGRPRAGANDLGAVVEDRLFRGRMLFEMEGHPFLLSNRIACNSVRATRLHAGR